jgi:thiosulfate/3-mercaptopyruvate sulfurtransferase
VKSNDVPGSSDKYTTLRSSEELEQEVCDVLGSEFARQVHAGERTIVTSCGSGMTAGVLWLGLKTMGIEKIGLYDEVCIL